MREFGIATRFVHDRLPGRVVFGAGSVEQVPREIDALDCHRVLLVAGGSAAGVGARLADTLGARAAGHFDRVAQHVPETLAAEASEVAGRVDADSLCSVGGGSATGLAKVVAVEHELPIVAVPTTYAGSEVTPVYGVTGERKHTARDLAALPRTVVYDPALTIGLPPRPTAASAFNALAHAVAALCAPHQDPIAALYAEEAAGTLARALPTAVRRHDDVDARGDLLYGAYLAASGLAAVGTGLHHRLCHALGGRCRLVHADVHALLLPYTVAGDEALVTSGRRRLAHALGVEDPVVGLRALAREVGLPDSLAAIGTPADQLEAVAADAAGAVDRAHPRAGDQAWFRGLLDDAYAGRPPEPHEPTTHTREAQEGPR